MIAREDPFGGSADGAVRPFGGMNTDDLGDFDPEGPRPLTARQIAALREEEACPGRGWGR